MYEIESAFKVYQELEKEYAQDYLHETTEYDGIDERLFSILVDERLVESLEDQLNDAFNYLTGSSSSINESVAHF